MLFVPSLVAGGTRGASRYLLEVRLRNSVSHSDAKQAGLGLGRIQRRSEWKWLQVFPRDARAGSGIGTCTGKSETPSGEHTGYVTACKSPGKPSDHTSIYHDCDMEP